MEPVELIHMDMYTACNIGDTEYVKETLQSMPMSVNSRNPRGWSALMYSCWNGNEELVSLLLENGASTKLMNHDNQTPLIIAVKGGYVNCVKLVFQRSLLDHTDTHGKCALFYAVEYGYFDIAKYLLIEGSSPNSSYRGTTVLMMAAINGQRALVEMLLDYGANVHKLNKQGFTACQLAARYGHSDIATLLDLPMQSLPDLKSFLKSLDLDKYWPIFRDNEVDFKTFLKMSEADFKSLGIKLLGPRRKMSLAIATYTKHFPTL